VSLPLIESGVVAYHGSRDDLPGNCTAGAMLLTALALFVDNLLAALHASEDVHRVELSLHSCKKSAMQNDAWIPASRAVHDLREVITSLVPIGPSMVEPYSGERVIQIWRDLRARESFLRRPLRSVIYAICGSRRIN
jgi:hypothetical protein